MDLQHNHMQQIRVVIIYYPQYHNPDSAPLQLTCAWRASADMDGLEWSTGSSTLWVLMRIRSLISIEHHAEWSALMESTMARLFHPSDLAARWKLYAVDAMPGTLEKGPDKEDITKFRCGKY